MSEIRANTDSIAATAAELARLSPDVSTAAARVFNASEAAAGTPAAAATQALNDQLARSIAEINAATDRLASVARSAADQYAAADRLPD
jgi:hypothetical protein